MRTNRISNQLFIKNRSKIKDLVLPGSTVIVFSSDEMPRNGDQYYPYRQSSDLFYLTGIEQEKTILVLSPGSRIEKYHEIIFIRKSTPEIETWNGKGPGMEEVSETSGIRNVYWLEDFERIFREVALSSQNIYLNYPEHFKVKPDIELRDERMAHKIKAQFPLHSFHRLAPILSKIRMIKEPEEIEQIREACRITGEAFRRILGFIKPDVKEYEVEAEITHEFLKQGAEGHAYEPIIASGENACVLHYTRNNDFCRDNELLLMDFGAEYSNYASDLSRTVPVNGKFTKRQAGLYDANLRVLKAAVKLMKPGILMADFHKQVCHLWQEEHIRLGLYKTTDIQHDDSKTPVWFRYYMHGTSHSIGLDVHDVFNKDEVFKPGMVLSCEPGIYIREEGLGIRLENDILITQNGNEDLMKDIPVEREEIIELMNS
jgi:Xaa-Pro aminopeptidase